MQRFDMSQQTSVCASDSHSTIDVLAEHVAVIDASGLIMEVNTAWYEFAEANGGNISVMSAGTNYLAVCDRAGERGCADAATAAALIRAVIGGKFPNAAMEYACDGPTEQRWFKLKITRSHVPGPARFVIEHENIATPSLTERQIRLQANMLASVEQAVIATDLSGTIVYWNPCAERLYGWAADEVLGKNILDITPAAATEAQAAQIMSSLQRGESWSGEFEVRHRSGRTIPIHVTDSPMRDERNQLIGIIGISTDITKEKKIKKTLDLSDMVYQAIGEAIIVVSMDGRIVAVNPAATRLTAYAEDELIDQPAEMLKSTPEEHFFSNELEPLLAKTGHWAGTAWLRRKDGKLIQEWLRIDTIYDQRAGKSLRICMFSPITDQKRAEQTIWRQANFDVLTGLPNRSMFRERLEYDIQKAGRAAQQLALMFIDLDQFKEVNDTLGHDIGDGLLRQAAARLTSCVRGVDMVARIGGDEFTVILGQLEEIGVVDRVARTIVVALAQPFHVAHHTIHMSASIGITLYPTDAVLADILVKNADQAMYAAKNHGRNQFHYFTQRMQNEAQLRMHMTNDLRDALANQRFDIAYQPIVELENGAIHKAEALLRWRHPVRGMINPVEFIPIAEQTGMIDAIGEWVFSQAKRQADVWRATIDPQFQVSVNMSPMQLRHRAGPAYKTFAQFAVASLDRSNASAPVILEITEGLFLESCDAVTELLQLLREARIQLAIDDFGTGYSALSYLRKFHVDFLKIDQSFVKRLGQNSDDMAMCEAIIAMAHKLDIKVIAEGIERDEQHDLLRSAGCDYGQGYLFSRPISASLLGKWLVATKHRSWLKERDRQT